MSPSGEPFGVAERRRRVLVSGASRGIGAAVARRIARTGSALWLTYAQDRTSAEAVAASCRALGAEEVRCFPVDLAETTSIQRLVAEVDRVWNHLDAVINNAAVVSFRPWTDIDVDDWDHVMAANARGTFWLTRALVPALRRAAPADRSITMVVSAAAEQGSTAAAMHYTASKGAVLALTKSLARTLAPEGIRVNAVSPGPTESGGADQPAEDHRRRLEAAVLLRRFGRPEEIAEIIAHIASPAASFVTGATIDVNGGSRIA